MQKDRKADLDLIKELRSLGAVVVTIGDVSVQFAPKELFQTISEPTDEPQTARSAEPTSPEEFEREQTLERVARLQA